MMGSAFDALALEAEKELKDRSRFIRWEPETIEGNPIKGKYKPIKGKVVEVKEVKTLEFDGRVRKIFPVVLELPDGKRKEFAASGKLVIALKEAGVKLNDVVEMTRSGEGYETTYQVKIIK